MAALFRFVDVHCEGSDHVYSFTLHSGETRLLELFSKAEKEALIDLAIGETEGEKGDIEIAQGDGKHDNEATPTIWRSLSTARPGRVGWVAANGGLISNLKIWENVTLPLWYHAKREMIETEQSVMHWLGKLGMEQDAFAEFMAASPYSAELWQRKLAGLLRALVQMPTVLAVDASVFEDVKEHMVHNWITALEAYATQGHAVLVIADKATTLPWKKIE